MKIDMKEIERIGGLNPRRNPDIAAAIYTLRLNGLLLESGIEIESENHRNAVLESAASIAEQIDNCREHEYDNGATVDGYRQAQKQIAEAIRRLKTNPSTHRPPSMPLYPSDEGDMTGTT